MGMALTLCFCLNAILAHAGTYMSGRTAVQAGVKTGIDKDLASPYAQHESISGRTCLDGRAVDGFQGDIPRTGRTGASITNLKRSFLFYIDYIIMV